MNLWARALIGAALGALLIFVAHPQSRGYFTALLRPGTSPVIASTPWLPENRADLHPPKSMHEVAYWVLVAAERESDGLKLSREDVTKLKFLVQYAAKEDVLNSFWKQMEAVYAWKLDERAEALELWLEASQRLLYNDWQTRRLEHIAAKLDEQEGSKMSWHQAYAYHRRSDAIALQIAGVAKEMHRAAERDRVTDLLTRYASVINAKLMREGGRSNAIADVAVEIGDDAATAGAIQPRASPRVVHVARLDLMHRLRDANRADLGAQVIAAYNDNDAWIALGRRGDTDENARQLTQISLFLGVLPSGFLVISVLGIAIAWIGMSLAMTRREAVPQLRPAYVAAGSPGPRPSRSLWPWMAVSESLPSLSTLARFGYSVAAMVWTAAAMCSIISFSAAVIELRPYIGPPLSYRWSSLIFISFAVAGIALLLVGAFLSAIRSQQDPRQAAGRVLQHFGRVLFLSNLIFAILLGPLAIYVDQQLGGTISKLLQNEPTYYLIQP
ncbi:MAG: hypothetical protein HONBIEJF_01667 [Fimbriimonadaceae bacterium]|nr:hypothetical protein [Fimbriimonadaceae bacterium]